MIRLLFLGALIGMLFWALPAGPAAAWSVIPGLLLAGVVYDALRRGRILLNRRRDDGGVDEVTNLTGQFLILHALWLGLHAPASGSESMPGVEGFGGGLEMTGLDGGFDGGAGGEGGF